MVRLAPDHKRREHVLKPAFVLIPQCLLGGSEMTLTLSQKCNSILSSASAKLLCEKNIIEIGAAALGPCLVHEPLAGCRSVRAGLFR